MDFARLSFDEIAVDEELQMRFSLSEERVEEFVEIYQDLPEWKVVLLEDGTYLLADGFHRREAARRRKEKEIDCLVTKGSYREALEIAVEANSVGPLPLTRAEKRKAVGKVLQTFPERADSWIAEMIGVSMQIVQKLRLDLENFGKIQRFENLMTRDGRKYPTKIAKHMQMNFENKNRNTDSSAEDAVAGVMQKITQQKTESGTGLRNMLKRKIEKNPEASFEDQEDEVGSVDSMFVNPPDLDGQLVSICFSVDGKKSVKVVRKGEYYKIGMFDLRGARFFPVDLFSLDSHDFKVFMDAIASDMLSSKDVSEN